VFADFVLICLSFLVAYALAVDGTGTDYERSVYLSALPILLGSRYVFFVALGVYRRVWAVRDGPRRRADRGRLLRFRGRRLPHPHRAAANRLVPRGPGLRRRRRPLHGARGASRLALRLLPETVAGRGDRRRVLVVGAGRAGRSLARELREGRDAASSGFSTTTPVCDDAGSSG
jgi:FlaA1/EpsC-like NDP-sugar epimerase